MLLYFGTPLEGLLNLDYEDFRIVIPMSEIVSARIFDPDVYELFQQEESSE